MNWKLELVVVPVSDVDRAKEFYEKQAGFTVDVDYSAGDAFRVVQLTPPGSACSISIGTGISTMEPGSLQGLHLVVPDIESAHAELSNRGVDISDFFHFGSAGQAPGLHPERAKYGTYCSFTDPDGNHWLLQEVGENA